MWTDSDGMQPQPVPREMTVADIERAREEYVQAARNAVAAGFDGIELHSANGYLLEQFIHPASNRRTDEYGGSIERRCRFVVEVAAAVAAAIGAERVGIRLSPYGVFNDMPLYDEIDEAYVMLAGALDEKGLVYLHLVNHSSMGAPAVDPATVRRIREAFSRTLILSGGYDRDRAEGDLQSGRADLVAFGRPFIANPDLPERLRTGSSLAVPDDATFYTADEKGYTDYPTR
jgi:N-ethylmaleimide reductase